MEILRIRSIREFIRTSKRLQKHSPYGAESVANQSDRKRQGEKKSQSATVYYAREGRNHTSTLLIPTILLIPIIIEASVCATAYCPYPGLRRVAVGAAYDSSHVCFAPSAVTAGSSAVNWILATHVNVILPVYISTSPFANGFSRNGPLTPPVSPVRAVVGVLLLKILDCIIDIVVVRSS